MEGKESKRSEQILGMTHFLKTMKLWPNLIKKQKRCELWVRFGVPCCKQREENKKKKEKPLSD